MSLETLALTVDDGLATIELRNEPVNAISQKMRYELVEALERVREDDVEAIVFTGNEDVFSVGADVTLFEEAQDWTTREFRANSRVLGNVFDGIEQLEKPVLAAINGTCVGGGAELALACDVRFASPEARLGFPEHNLGLLPGLGGCSRLVHLVGPGKAKDLIFSGELIDGRTAKDIRLVERLTADPERSAAEYARALLEQPPQAVGLTKRIVNAARDADTQTSGLLESLAQSTLLETRDHEEGLDAFRNKRDPEFTGE